MLRILMPSSRAVFVLAALLMAAASCGQQHVVSVRSTPPPAWLLTVRNHHWLDVEVFVVHGGMTTRVGLVTATMDQSFPLSTHLLEGGAIQLLGHRVGGGANGASEQIRVGGGQTVQWELERTLLHASLSVH